MFFKCKISYNELVSIQKNLSADSYCITKDAVDDYHYGIIDVRAFDKLLNVLSGETLGELEYLAEDEFKSAVEPARGSTFVGNTTLMN